MLEESGEELSYNKRWAIVRTLERADYYRAMKLIDKKYDFVLFFDVKAHGAMVVDYFNFINIAIKGTIGIRSTVRPIQATADQ